MLPDGFASYCTCKSVPLQRERFCGFSLVPLDPISKAPAHLSGHSAESVLSLRQRYMTAPPGVQEILSAFFPVIGSSYLLFLELFRLCGEEETPMGPSQYVLQPRPGDRLLTSSRRLRPLSSHLEETYPDCASGQTPRGFE